MCHARLLHLTASDTRWTMPVTKPSGIVERVRTCRTSDLSDRGCIQFRLLRLGPGLPGDNHVWRAAAGVDRTGRFVVGLVGVEGWAGPGVAEARGDAILIRAAKNEAEAAQLVVRPAAALKGLVRGGGIDGAGGRDDSRRRASTFWRCGTSTSRGRRTRALRRGTGPIPCRR